MEITETLILIFFTPIVLILGMSIGVLILATIRESFIHIKRKVNRIIFDKKNRD